MKSFPTIHPSSLVGLRASQRRPQHLLSFSRHLASNVPKTSSPSRPSTPAPSLINSSRTITSLNSSHGDDKKRSWQAEFEDFRPPWVYTAERVLQYTLIPGMCCYYRVLSTFYLVSLSCNPSFIFLTAYLPFPFTVEKWELTLLLSSSCAIIYGFPDGLGRSRTCFLICE